jgi:hypothetical protein
MVNSQANEQVIASGGQAIVSRFRDDDGRSWVSKRYREQSAVARFSALDEWYKLSELMRCGAFEAHGWTVEVPTVKPLIMEPLQLTEAWFDGLPLLEVADSQLESSVFDALAEWLVMVWLDQMVQIGDFRFSNILINIETRRICVVDLGMPAPEYAALHVTSDYRPASNDVAYLVFTMASERFSRAYWRTARRSERLGRRLLERLLPLLHERDKSTLSNTEAACWFFLARIGRGRGFRRVWRLLVDKVIARRMRRLLKGFCLTKQQLAIEVKLCVR